MSLSHSVVHFWMWYTKYNHQSILEVYLWRLLHIFTFAKIKLVAELSKAYLTIIVCAHTMNVLLHRRRPRQHLLVGLNVPFLFVTKHNVMARTKIEACSFRSLAHFTCTICLVSVDLRCKRTWKIASKKNE
jgi:hypothetical protein